MGPLGCSPGVVVKNHEQNSREFSCDKRVTQLVKLHNQIISTVLINLSCQLQGLKYGIFDLYVSLRERISHPLKYGSYMCVYIYIYIQKMFGSAFDFNFYVSELIFIIKHNKILLTSQNLVLINSKIKHRILTFYKMILVFIYNLHLNFQNSFFFFCCKQQHFFFIIISTKYYIIFTNIIFIENLL